MVDYPQRCLCIRYITLFCLLWERVETNLIEQSCQMLGRAWQLRELTVETMMPDGSLRGFCRLRRDDGSRRVIIAPPGNDPVGICEARSGWHIGRHLSALGVPVPKLYHFDNLSGLMICEDLGDVRLHDLIVEQGCCSSRVMELYNRVVEKLACMQVRGRTDFDCSWCWDGARYDRAVMLDRESGYFLQALCRDLLRLSVVEQEILRDFSALADRAGQADASFFLHRDFQSRNIMVAQGRIRFIDYQAGRLGPAAYDLASLLIDPYAALPASLQEQLLDHYLDVLTELVPYDRSLFMEEYLVLAIQRNMQILGAFAFLSNRRGKPFFRQYIKPSLLNLETLLSRTAPEAYSCLKGVTARCLAAAG